MNVIHDIGCQLKAFRVKTKTKMPTIALATGIPKETLYKWEKGTKPSDINDYFKLQAYLDKVEGEYSEQLFRQEEYKPAKLWLPFDPNLTPIPNTNIKESTGSFSLLNDEPGIIADRINAPILGPVDGMVEVTGESMTPTFPNGCRVGLIRTNAQMLHWGQYYYIIDKNYKGYVRRVCPGKDYSNILLVSDHLNQDLFPPILRQRVHIIGMFQIIVTIIKQ